MTGFLLTLLLMQQANPAEEPAQEHHLGEELVTGQAEVRISDLKPYFSPQIDPFAPINDLLSPGSYVFEEALYRTVDSITVPHHFIRSSYLRVPVERSFIYGDIMVFLPSFEKRVATWELVVSNSLGETIRRVSRRGQPPAVISWDGRTETGELVATGDIYNITFNAYDAQGNQTRIPGSPQRILALVTKQDNEWIISLAADLVFEDDRAALTEEATGRLDEAANIIKEHFRKEVVVYVYSEQEKLSQDRCSTLKSELARRIVLPRDALKVAPRFVPGLQPKHSRVEIHII